MAHCNKKNQEERTLEQSSLNIIIEEDIDMDNESQDTSEEQYEDLFPSFRYIFYPKGFENHYGYLNPGELCYWSKLTLEELIQLYEARLLVPDRKDGKYRPKLVHWAEKLKYLLDEGWTIPEIKAWAAGRFKTGKPYFLSPDPGGLADMSPAGGKSTKY